MQNGSLIKVILQFNHHCIEQSQGQKKKALEVHLIRNILIAGKQA